MRGRAVGCEGLCQGPRRVCRAAIGRQMGPLAAGPGRAPPNRQSERMPQRASTPAVIGDTPAALSAAAEDDRTPRPPVQQPPPPKSACRPPVGRWLARQRAHGEPHAQGAHAPSHALRHGSHLGQGGAAGSGGTGSLGGEQGRGTEDVDKVKKAGAYLEAHARGLPVGRQGVPCEGAEPRLLCPERSQRYVLTCRPYQLVSASNPLFLCANQCHSMAWAQGARRALHQHCPSGLLLPNLAHQPCKPPLAPLPTSPPHLVHQHGARQAPSPRQPRPLDGRVLPHHHHLHGQALGQGLLRSQPEVQPVACKGGGGRRSGRRAGGLKAGGYLGGT